MNTSYDERLDTSWMSEGRPTLVRLHKLSALPPLPRRSQDLLRLLCNRDLDILRLIEIVEQTPALAPRIMGVATSPFFLSGRMDRLAAVFAGCAS